MFELEAKKSLGQNFLKNPSIIERIVDAGEIEEGDIVLEIGPGTGAMTAIILDHITEASKTAKNKAKLIVIEKDQRAIPILTEKFREFIEKGVLEVIEGDFLEMEIGKIIKKPYKIIANIPYYITGAIIRKAMEDAIKPKTAIFLVQKEVAERIARREGKDKDWGKRSNILAESIGAYGKAEYMFTVARGNFVPIPKVDSAAIRISDISGSRFDESGVSEELFFETMKAGFAHKRKKLAGNLKEHLIKKQTAAGKTPDPEEISERLRHIFSTEGIGGDARAEEISTDTWFKIARSLRE